MLLGEQHIPKREFEINNLCKIGDKWGGIRGGLTGCIIGSPRNVSCAVSFFSRGFSRGFDKHHEFIPNESLDRSIRVFEFPIQIKGNKKQ